MLYWILQATFREHVTNKWWVFTVFYNNPTVFIFLYILTPHFPVKNSFSDKKNSSSDIFKKAKVVEWSL